MSNINHNKETKTKYVIAFLVLIFIGNFSTIFMLNLVEYQSIDKLNRYNNDLRDIRLKSQGIVQDDYTIEWLDNTNFTAPITPWYNTTEGDVSDVNASISSGAANFEVLGDQGTYSFVADPPLDPDWIPAENPDFPSYPDTYVINESGACVSHYWIEDAGQNIAVNWERNVTVPVNMSDYKITSASLDAVVNASVHAPSSQPYSDGIEAGNDLGTVTNQNNTGDYVRFYVRISDLSKNETHEIGSYQTTNLGQDSPEISTLSDISMTPETEETLKFYLTQVLSEDNRNFTIAIGMRIWCEDNFPQDSDWWKLLIIKSINLTFSYEKNIDQDTSVSWNQVGNKLTGANIDIKNATLNFKYKIDKSWTTSSPNAEFIVYINDRDHTETVKLSTANTTFQDIKIGGFDVTSLILKDVNISVSIQVYLADTTFNLNETVIISIDNASLLISYTENTVETETKLDIFLDTANKTLLKSIEVTMGNPVNISVIYKNQTTNNFIPNAEVQLVGLGAPKNLTENGSLEHYNITIQSSNLQIGNNFLTISASKKYYESISELINIKVIERETDLQLILDSTNKTMDKSIQMIYGNNGNITITYKDIEQLPGTHIDNAIVELIGIGDTQNLTKHPSYNQYFIIIDTKDLGLGNSFLTINADKENYTAQSIRFKIEVLESNSYIDKINLNGTETTSIEIPWNEILSISLSYNESSTDSFISDALVQLSGTGISENFTENSPIDYSLNINTALMALGINFLTISANKENYTLSSRIITISVTERDTKIDVYLNGTISSNFEFYNISIGEKLNITVLYKDLSTDSFINDANVRLIESGVPTNLTESLIFIHYNITINVDDLGAGVKFLTISAKADNYTLTSEVITLIINEKKTQLLLFLNGTQQYNGDTVKLEVTDTLNITVKYLDNLTKDYLGGAVVDIINQDYLTENALLEHYNITIDIIDLNSTLNRIIIRAHVDNYQTGLIEFFIQIIERGSTGTLFINQLNKTADPYIDLTLGSLLNLTIKYTDVRAENHISGATVQLDGDLTDLLSEFIALEQYSIIINTTDLGVGLNIFTIIAERANFEFFIIQKLYVSVDRIRTNITTTDGVSNIVKRPGESVTLSIVINNLDFGGIVEGANVTYRWIFGEGVLTENNGIYTKSLTDIPEGSYTLTIYAETGEEYDFASFKIVLSVIIPVEDLYLFQLLSIIGGIAAAALVTYLYLYQKIFKYPKPVRKVRKYNKTLRKTSNPRVDITAREKAFKVEYKNELAKSSKLLKGKSPEVSSMPDKMLKKPIESPDE